MGLFSSNPLLKLSKHIREQLLTYAQTRSQKLPNNLHQVSPTKPFTKPP